MIRQIHKTKTEQVFFNHAVYEKINKKKKKNKKKDLKKKNKILLKEKR